MAFLGKFFLKNANTARVMNDGMTHTIFAKVIPPYTKVTRYWVHQWVVSDGNEDIAKHAEYRVTGVYDTVPNRLDQTENWNDINMETYWQRFFAEGATSGDSDDASWGDADDAEAAEYDIEISGGQRVTSVAKAQRVFNHEKMLGFPRNAVLNGVGDCRFIDEWTRKGTVSNRGRKLEQAKMFMIGSGYDEPDVTSDEGDHMWGDTSNLSDASEMLTGIFSEGGYDIASGMDNIPATYPNVDKWLKKGIIKDVNYFSTEYGLAMITKVTLEVKTYSPHSQNIISAP